MKQDEAEKLARELRPLDFEVNYGRNPPTSARKLRALCDHILCGDMKREIENAAWRPISELPQCDDPMWFARKIGKDWEVDGPRGYQPDDEDWWQFWSPCEWPALPDALITPAKTADTEG